jgi:hypothetical protein
MLEEMKEEKETSRVIDVPWAGNLGSWYWYIKTNQVICNDQKISGFRITERRYSRTN